jgi:hypothetical protein
MRPANSGVEPIFLPALREPGQGPGVSTSPAAPALDYHVDGAGGDGELAPGLVVERHPVLDALGAGQALEGGFLGSQFPGWKNWV